MTWRGPYFAGSDPAEGAPPCLPVSHDAEHQQWWSSVMVPGGVGLECLQPQFHVSMLHLAVVAFCCHTCLCTPASARSFPPFVSTGMYGLAGLASGGPEVRPLGTWKHGWPQGWTRPRMFRSETVLQTTFLIMVCTWLPPGSDQTQASTDLNRFMHMVPLRVAPIGAAARHWQGGAKRRPPTPSRSRAVKNANPAAMSAGFTGECLRIGRLSGLPTKRSCLQQ